MSNQDGSDNTQQNIDKMHGGTVKGRETNIHLSGVLVTVVALALVVLVGLIVLRPAEAPAQPTATPTPTPIPAGSQPESYLFYVDVSANMNKVIGGKRAYDWAQDVIADFLRRIEINPENTRSALLRVGGGGDATCNEESLIAFERGRAIPVQDYLAPLQQNNHHGDSAYRKGFQQVLPYFNTYDLPQEKKYLFVFMGSPFGTPGCYPQDNIDLPGLIDAYTASGVDVDLCAFSFFGDLGEYNRLRRRIEEYGIECVRNITSASEAEAAASLIISIISNNRVLFENTPTPAPPTVTRTLTPTPRPTDTPAATNTPTATATPSPTVTPIDTPNPGYIDLTIYRDTTFWALYIPDFDRSLYNFSIEAVSFQVDIGEELRTYSYSMFGNIADDNLVSLSNSDICIVLFTENDTTLPLECAGAGLIPRAQISAADRFWRGDNSNDYTVAILSPYPSDFFCSAGTNECRIQYPLTSLHLTPEPTGGVTPIPPIVEPTATPSVIIGVVLGDPLNLRDGPDEAFSIVGNLELGTVIQILGQNGDWFFIETSSGLQAWVAKSLVSQIPENAAIPFVDTPP